MLDALENLSDVFQRSQLTGVSTDEYNAALAAAGFAPDEWYEATLALQDAGFDTDKPSESYILEYGPEISDQGYGNLSYSPDFDLIESLTSRGFDPEIAGLEPNQNNYYQQAENNYLKRTGVKYVPKISDTTQLGNGTVTGSNFSGFGTGSGTGSVLNKGQSVGASDGQMLGAGNAEYQSPLIQALRNASATPFSNNKGITEYTFAPGSAGSVGTVNKTTGDAANNPENLFADVASADDVANWNNYNTYRTNSLNAKTPYVSFSEWLTGGKPDGSTKKDETTVIDFGSNGGGGDGGGSGGDSGSSDGSGGDGGDGGSAGGDGGDGGSGGDGGGDGGGGDGGSGGGDGGGWANGGMVTKDRLSGPNPAGPDDGYGALDDGEFVLTAEAVKKMGPMGLEILRRLNARDRK